MSKKQPLDDLAKHASHSRSPAPLDPIEAAKAGGEADSSVASADSAAPTEEPALPELSDEKLPPAEVADGVVRTAGVHVVQNRITIPWGLQSINLKPGDEVTEDSYGDGAIERMRGLGVSLKEKA